MRSAAGGFLPRRGFDRRPLGHRAALHRAGPLVDQAVPRVRVRHHGARDVDYVVTEHGVAELRGCSLAERARRMIAVAAPEHREHLDIALTEHDLAS